MILWPSRLLSNSCSLSSSAGHRRRAKPPGHMGPPFVMGLSARREKSSISPDTAKVRYKLAESGFFELAGHMHYRWYSKKGIETKL